MKDWLDVIACPACRGILQSRISELDCAHCASTYPISDGIPALIRKNDVSRLTGFSRLYRKERLRDGWRAMTPEQAMALPYGRPPGYPPLYWEVRRQSFRALSHALSRWTPPSDTACAADLGAGTGWLSYRLSQRGYRVVAVEASRDDMFGLGAAGAYSMPRWIFLPVHGNLEYPPLREGAFDLVVFNASLHYAEDLESTLRRSVASLKTGGWLVVMDTPVARSPRPGTGRGDRHLGQHELSHALETAGLAQRWVTVWHGPRWWLHQVKVLLKGHQAFAFPMIVAERR